MNDDLEPRPFHIGSTVVGVQTGRHYRVIGATNMEVVVEWPLHSLGEACMMGTSSSLYRMYRHPDGAPLGEYEPISKEMAAEAGMTYRHVEQGWSADFPNGVLRNKLNAMIRGDSDEQA